MNKKVKLTILTVLLLLISFGSIVFAENFNDLQDKKNELQNQINESNEKIEEIQIEITENLEQLNSLNEKIANYENDILIYQKKLEEIEKQIDEVTKKLSIIEENYNLQKDALQNRIVALYEAGDVVYLDVLLNSNSISDFISNYYLIGEIVKYDNDILKSIETQKTKIEDIKNALEQRRNEFSEIKKNKEKTAIALENSRVIRNSYINKLTEEEKNTQEKIDKYKAELNNIDSQILALTTLNISSDFMGGEFIWPAPGYSTITSKFGSRVHPILKVVRNHSGNDIAMPTGAAVVASNDGVVIKSMYSTSGYGNMILIDHGGGIATLYAHASELIAQTGQTVKRGDIIMKAGSTGWSTGPHLHFEVRINGTPIDSLEFLNNQSNYLKDTNKKNEQDNQEKEENKTNTNN